MTRRHYIDAASRIRDMRRLAACDADMNAAYQAQELLVGFFKSDNARFDADKFRSACRLSGDCLSIL